MFRNACVIALFLLALAACHRLPKAVDPAETPSPELLTVDSLLWQQPDSALACLVSCFDACTTTEYNRHYANLLLAELLYKNDYAQTNRAALQQAVAYYDSVQKVSLPPFKGVPARAGDYLCDQLAFYSARAHYINGVGYYENDSAVPSCREYLKALEIMEGNFEEKELTGHKAKFMALTYTHLTTLFSDMYLHEQAIYFAQLSLPYYQKHNASSEHIAWVLNSIGSHFEVIENLDSAGFYYQKAITCLNDSNLLIYRDISAHQAYLKYEITNQANFSLIKLNCLLSKAEYEREIMARSLSIGEIYYHEKQFDSALVYLQKVFIGNARTDSKKQAAEWLVEICKVQGRETDIMKYADFLVPFANKEENQSAIKSQLTELYNAFRQGVSDRQHQHIVRKNAQWTTVAIGVLLIIIFAIICFYYKNKQRLKLLENQKPEESANTQDRLLAFMGESVCQKIIQSVQGQNIKRMATPKAFPELVLTDAQLQQLNMLVTHYFGPMDNLLEKHNVKAKPALVNLCHLYLLGMDEKQAAILLNRDYSSVKRYEKTLKMAFNTQKNMVAFLRSFVLNS